MATLNGSDVALLRLAVLANGNPPQSMPLGFTPVTSDVLGPNLLAQRGFGATSDGFNQGLYTNFGSAALVTIGTLSGVTTLVVSFRGAISETGSVTELQYAAGANSIFTTLLAHVDALVAAQGIHQVAVTGAGLGGTSAQLFMSTHADTASVHYIADTFGSPGAPISAGTDARINVIQIADDPVVYVGQNRASLPAQLQANPSLASSPLFTVGAVFPGLTSADLTAALPSFTSNYVNRGTVTLLPDADGTLTAPTSLAAAATTGLSEPLVTTYLSRLEASVNSIGDDQAGGGITPTTTGVQVFRFFDQRNGGHFYTTSATERDTLRQAGSGLFYEGVGLNAANPSTDPAAAPVYRFFDTRNGSHFYTTSGDEKTTLQATRPDLAFEGTAFYENLTPQANDAPVYRFFDTTDGSHFYTANLNEYASVLATRTDLINEGLAFYTAKS